MKARALTLCLALSLAAAAPLFAGGQGEPRLAEAQRLIEKQDYSEALLMLAAIQRENPDLKDETSRLISQVIIFRGQMYNNVLAQLVQAVYVDHDQEKAVILVEELQRIDPSRTVSGADNAIEYVKFLNLMNRAAVMLAQGRPADALSLYVLPFSDPKKAGFTMQKAGFDAAGYGKIVQAAVGDAASRILAIGSQEIKAADAIGRVPSELDAYLSKQPAADSTGAFDVIVSPLLDAAQAEGLVRGIAGSLGDMNRSIQETSGKGKPDPYIQYLVWLSMGREKKTEGIAEAIRRLWVDRAKGVAARTSTAATTTFDSARALYLASRYDEATATFDAAAARGTVAVKAAGLAAAALGATPATGWALSVQDAQESRDLLLLASMGQENVAEAAAYKTLIGYKKDLAALPDARPEAPVDGTQAEAEAPKLVALRGTINARSNDADAAQQEWEARAAEWAAKTKLGLSVDPLVLSAKRVAEEFQAFGAGELASKDLLYALRLGRLGSRDFPGRLESAKALSARARDLMDGTVNGKLPAGDNEIIPKHPLEALPLLQKEVDGLDGLTRDIADLEQKLHAEKPYVLASTGFTTLFSGGGQNPGLDPLMLAVQQEKTMADQMLAAAQERADNAAVLSKEGDNWFTAASNALAKKDPDGASTFLEKANDSYIRSQGIAYTDHAVTRTDKEVPALQAQVAGLRTQLAIANAQKDLAVIDQRLNARDFLGASDALAAAQRSWDQAQPGSPNPSFEIRRENIQNALQFTEGRDISRLDPKADVVNTFIKYAQDNLAAGRLDEALQNVNYALNVAPNFGTAKVLKLQIKKTTDPVGFQKEAASQIAAYMKMAADAKNRKAQSDAYNALLDYSRLDPKFAALTKDTVLELEYNLGFKNRPASAKEIADSNALVQQADLLQQQGTPESYQGALDLIRQALRKNPANRAATDLDGQIRTKLQSTALSVLSPADTQRYKQALSLYLSGAYQDAYDLVLALWSSSPRNKTYADLIRLRKRCEVALNIS